MRKECVLGLVCFCVFFSSGFMFAAGSGGDGSDPTFLERLQLVAVGYGLYRVAAYLCPDPYSDSDSDSEPEGEDGISDAAGSESGSDGTSGHSEDGGEAAEEESGDEDVAGGAESSDSAVLVEPR